MSFSHLRQVCSAFAFLALSTGGLVAQEVYLDEGETEKTPSRFMVPYLFPSDTLDLAFGLGGVSSGGLQPQAAFGWALMGSSNGSYGIYGGGVNYRIPGTQRLFVDPLVAISHFAEMRSYQDLPFGMDPFAGRAGSNESSIDDYIQDEGWDIRVETRFRYLLPIGQGRDETIHTYHMNQGLISDGFTGGEAFNPFTSGRTYLLFTPFYRNRSYDKDENDVLLSNSNGLQAGIEWDNRNFVASPSRGERFKFLWTEDFDWFDSSGSYSVWEVEASKYFELPETSWARQQVLAFGFYTSDTPSWDENADGSVSGRAPEYLSPNLGGFSRMRAFPFNRYNDRSAVYYTAEYRYMPQWNPWEQIGFINRWLDPAWWQIVPFVELGRVAPDYDFSTLHEDMQWDAGVSFRFMLKKSVIRADWATSEDNSSFWVMFGQPF